MKGSVCPECGDPVVGINPLTVGYMEEVEGGGSVPGSQKLLGVFHPECWERHKARLEPADSGRTESSGENWTQMDARPRREAASLTQADIPSSPGVYALYRDGEAVYVGKATILRSRLWNNHLRKGVSMTNSALRRNVAEFLGLASAADIKAGRYSPTALDARRVSEWIGEAEVAWIECDSVADAVLLEGALKAERKPPLTKL